MLLAFALAAWRDGDRSREIDAHLCSMVERLRREPDESVVCLAHAARRPAGRRAAHLGRGDVFDRGDHPGGFQEPGNAVANLPRACSSARPLAELSGDLPYWPVVPSRKVCAG